jgi:hypothetical protein
MRKNTFEKKISAKFYRVTRVTGQPSKSTGFIGFLLIIVFCFIQINPTIELTCQTNSNLITMP